MHFSLPYGRGKLEGEIEDRRILAVVRNRNNEGNRGKTETELVQEAVDHPIKSSPLTGLAEGKKKIVILASDHTRPVPSRVIAPVLLRRLREAGSDPEITFLIASGCHRKMTEEELKEKFGEEIVKKEKILFHDCDDRQNMVDLGTLPGGGRLMLNRIAAGADLLLSEGFIEPHFFAGFSGGRKSVLPGIASRETVYANHCSAFISNPNARSGNLEQNPIHRDMVFAAKAAGLRFIVNVVLDSEKKILGAFAGEPEAAHQAGVNFLETFCKVKVQPAEIVVTTNNGYPLDQNMYQAVKGMTAAESVCREGGVIIMAAACADGVGGAGFYETFRKNRDAGRILRQIESVPASRTEEDQWQSQIFARILEKKRVILISEADRDIVEEMHMIPAGSLEEAVNIADRILGHPGDIIVIAEGVSSIAEPDYRYLEPGGKT